MTKKPKTPLSKCSKPELIRMVHAAEKRIVTLNKQIAKLKAQLAPAPQHDEYPLIDAPSKKILDLHGQAGFKIALSNPFMSADEATLAETFGVVHVKQPTPLPANKMPWE